MAKKIDQIFHDLSQYVDKIENSVDESVSTLVGAAVRERMLQFISRGISPILGFDRFPEYKGAKKARNFAEVARASKREASSFKKLGSSFNRRLAKQAMNKAKSLSKTAAQLRNSSYPYNTKQFKAGTKRARPVNLYLTGDFLSLLTYKFQKINKRMRMVIGFFDKQSSLKEKGHREGANGQLKRPIIPTGSQVFNQTIQLDIMKLVRDAVTKAAKSAKKG